MANTGSGLEVFTNDATGTVAAAQTAVAAGTSQSWTVNVTAAFPVASTGVTPATFFYAADPAVPSEVMLVTVCPGGTGSAQAWTVIRGADGTTPAVHSAGFTVQQVLAGDSVRRGRPGWFNVKTMFGAAGDGSTDDTAAIQAAVNAAIPAGGVVFFPAGSYKFTSTVSAVLGNASPFPSVIFQGEGMTSTVLKSFVTGVAVDMHSTRAGAPSLNGGSGFRDICIDGTNAAAGSTGLQIGDIEGIKIDHLQVQNFVGTGSIGIHFFNQFNWTEEATVRAFISKCTTGVLYSSNATGGGTNSFGYGVWDFVLYQGFAGSFDGISLDGTAGANVYHGSMRVRGNFNSSATAITSAVLRFAAGAQMGGMHLDFAVESNPGTGTTSKPTTIVMDSASQMLGCYGTMDFSEGGSTAAMNPASIANGQLQFTGVISGDTNLSAGAGYDKWVWASTVPAVYSGPYGYSGGGFPTVLGDMFFTQLSANINGNVTSSFFNGGATLGVPQRVTIIIKQAASGGPFTVTWQNNATPSLTAPTIVWQGGLAPQMSTSPNAIDIYRLETTDGITWYGSATQVDYLADAEQYVALTAAYTLTSTTSLQKLFNVPVNGSFQANAATSYFFETEFDLSAMSATSGDFKFGFGGTATLTSVRYLALAQKAAAVGTPTTAQITIGTAAAATSIVSASTITTGTASIRGIIRVNAAGTLIPQVGLGVAAAAIVAANSWFRIQPVGSNTQTSLGNWS